MNSSQTHKFAPPTLDEAREALSFISAGCDRDRWFRVAAGVYHEFGDQAFGMFDDWSKTSSEKYSASDVRSTWRSLRNVACAKPVTFATVARFATEAGWRRSANQLNATHEEARQQARMHSERQAHAEAEVRRRHEVRAVEARRLVQVAAASGLDPRSHPYWKKKNVDFGNRVVRGEWPQRGWRDALLVGAYDTEGVIRSCQAINSDGVKDSLRGAKLGGTFHPIGSSFCDADVILVGEGLATVAAAVQACAEGASVAGLVAFGQHSIECVAGHARHAAGVGCKIVVLSDRDTEDIGKSAAARVAANAALAVRGHVFLPEWVGAKRDAWDVFSNPVAGVGRRPTEGLSGLHHLRKCIEFATPARPYWHDSRLLAPAFAELLAQSGAAK